MLQRQFSSCDIPVFAKTLCCGDRIMTYGIANGAFLLVLTIFVAGTVCKSSAHDATLKIGVILSPFHDARIQTSWISCNMLRGQNSVPQQNVFGKNRGCQARKTVAATCPRDMSPSVCRPYLLFGNYPGVLWHGLVNVIQWRAGRMGGGGRGTRTSIMVVTWLPNNRYCHYRQLHHYIIIFC